MSKTPRKPEQPILWIIAGPNGSGKSSLYNRTDIEGWGGSVWIINPDLLTLHIQLQEGCALDVANLAAVNRIQSWLEASIEVYQTIGVETVLSSPKYQTLVHAAQQRGFRVKMIYVLLDSADLQLERIRIRVSEGGHDVPVDKVIGRRRRSFEQLAWFAGAVDECYVYDNSTGEPEKIAEKHASQLYHWGELPPELEEILLAGDVPLHNLM